jgi:hypothetical protein
MILPASPTSPNAIVTAVKPLLPAGGVQLHCIHCDDLMASSPLCARAVAQPPFPRARLRCRPSAHSWTASSSLAPPTETQPPL